MHKWKEECRLQHHRISLFIRLRFFNQLEDELQSHQHEEQWLRDKGNQLAQRDAELAGEVLREISLLETTWEDTKRLITERYWSFSTLLQLQSVNICMALLHLCLHMSLYV